MYYFDARDLSGKENYKFLTGSIIPRPVAWIATRNEETGKINLAPFSYFSIVSKEPALISVSINRVAGEPKDTAYHLLQNREAVVHIVNDQLLEEMNQTAANLPREDSEFDLLDQTLVDSHYIEVPGIEAAPVRLETKLYQHIPVTDSNGTVISDLLILEVLRYGFAENVFDEEHQYILPMALNPVSRLAGINYGHLDGIVAIPRPK